MLKKAVYSDELWRFDPSTTLFTQLGWKSEEAEEEEESPWPRGREQRFITALPNGCLVLVGGLSSSNEDFTIEKEANVLLKDVWTMRDPRRVIPNVVFSSDNNAIDLIPGHVTSHVMPVSLRDEVHGVSVGEEDMCKNRLTVKFSFDHICPNGIQYIKLTGPGKQLAARMTTMHPKVEITRQKSVSWWFLFYYYFSHMLSRWPSFCVANLVDVHSLFILRRYL